MGFCPAPLPRGRTSPSPRLRVGEEITGKENATTNILRHLKGKT